MPFSPPPYADAISPPPQRRRNHALALLAAVGVMGAVVARPLMDDPRPLEVQLSDALGDAGQALNGWQDQLSSGLQASMLAVAQGHDLPAASPTAGADDAASAPASAQRGQ